MNLRTYIHLDALDLAELVKKKEIAPGELIQLSFQQLEKVNPSLNIVTSTRKEKALAEAENLHVTDDPFIGVPLLLKNSSQSVEGELLTSGSQLLKSNIAARDSHFAAKIRKAGFVMTGHTNTPEFGLKNITEPILHGPTRNPWHPDYSPGGSSGGSAAAVAAGVVPLAGASDGGGSIRIPASFTSLFGLKPTRGRTPVGPGVGRQWQGAAIDFVLSRTVRDSAAMLDALQVVQPSAAFHTPLLAGNSLEMLNEPFKKRLRIAFSTKSPVGTPVSRDAENCVNRLVQWAEREGHDVEEKDQPVNGIKLMEWYYLMNSGEIAALIDQLERTLGQPISKNDVEVETWMLNEAGKSVSAAQFAASLSAWDEAAALMADFHEEYDLYITPATAYPAPKIGELTHSEEEQARMLRHMEQAQGMKEKQSIIWEMFLPSLSYTPFTQLANLTGQPAMSIPIYLSAEGLPLGAQVMAGKGAERILLQFASQVEQTDLWVGMKGNPLYI